MPGSFDLFVEEARAISRLAELQRTTDPLRRPTTYRVDFYLAYSGGGEHRAASHQAADDLELARRMAHAWLTAATKPTTTKRALIVETRVFEQLGPEVLDLSPEKLVRAHEPSVARPFFDTMNDAEQAEHLEDDHDAPGWEGHNQAAREQTHVDFHTQDDASHYHDEREEART